jgi:broad specificity phosphatase PhoE
VTELVIVRHAQSVWNAEGRWQGWADPPLSAWGEEQAAEAGRTLGGPTASVGPPDVFASSDLRRARRTAELLSDGFRAGRNLPGSAEIIVDPNLREYDAGEWTGLRREEIAARWPRELADWDTGELVGTPGGEDRVAFVARLLAALQRIREVVPAGRVLAVSHGRAIRAVGDALGASGGRIENLTGWRIELDPAPVLVSGVALLGGPGTGEAADAARQDL